jgi:hypothetical protein
MTTESTAIYLNEAQKQKLEKSCFQKCYKSYSVQVTCRGYIFDIKGSLEENTLEMMRSIMDRFDLSKCGVITIDDEVDFWEIKQVKSLLKIPTKTEHSLEFIFLHCFYGRVALMRPKKN